MAKQFSGSAMTNRSESALVKLMRHIGKCKKQKRAEYCPACWNLANLMFEQMPGLKRTKRNDWDDLHEALATKP